MWLALNLAGHLTSLSSPARAQNPLLPIGVTSLVRTRGGGLGVFVSDTPPIFYDVAEVIPITVIFPRIAILCDAAARIVLG
jgi:hypothetical protein